MRVGIAGRSSADGRARWRLAVQGLPPHSKRCAAAHLRPPAPHHVAPLPPAPLLGRSPRHSWNAPPSPPCPHLLPEPGEHLLRVLVVVLLRLLLSVEVVKVAWGRGGSNAGGAARAQPGPSSGVGWLRHLQRIACAAAAAASRASGPPAPHRRTRQSRGRWAGARRGRPAARGAAVRGKRPGGVRAPSRSWLPGAPMACCC